MTLMSHQRGSDENGRCVEIKVSEAPLSTQS
jgi:hypothetical protein